MLWQRLSNYDKGRIVYSQRYREKPQGRFKASKSTVTPGAETTKKYDLFVHYYYLQLYLEIECEIFGHEANFTCV